jgi:Aspartyl/Asparaginyl beta-hydroxylase
MYTASDLSRIAREAERVYASHVEAVEKEMGQELDRLKKVRFTVDTEMPVPDHLQHPHYRVFPRLTAKPFWDLNDFPDPLRDAFSRFETESSRILDEFRNSKESQRYQPGSTAYHGRSENWRQMVILEDDLSFSDIAKSKFPHLCSIIRDLLDLNAVNRTYFALMRSGMHLPSHCGGANILLRMHLGIDVPEGDLGITVGGVTRRWANGKTLFFDDTFGHEAWNRSELDRVVLLVRLLHPELAASERLAFEKLQVTFGKTDACKAAMAALAWSTSQKRS